jgi:CheY-like chemotaxis protein
MTYGLGLSGGYRPSIWRLQRSRGHWFVGRIETYCTSEFEPKQLELLAASASHCNWLLEHNKMFGHALVVDDQTCNVESLQQMKSSVHDYVFVSDTRTALYVLYEYEIDHNLDVIACNANMLNGDVFEFLRAVKGELHLSTIPLVCYCVTPNLGLQSLRVVAETLGADEFIASNAFDAKTVCREIERWLTRGHGYGPPTELGGYDGFASL